MAEEYKDIDFFYGEILSWDMPREWVEEIRQEALNLAKEQIPKYNDVVWDIDEIKITVDAHVSFARYGDEEE